MSARTQLICVLATLIVLTASVTHPPRHTMPQRSAEAQDATDKRERIALAPAERDAILVEMRVMLQSVSGIVRGVVAGDLAMVEQAARASGTIAALDPKLAKKLPPHFLQLDARVRRRFDQLADATRTGATNGVMKPLATLTGYCVTCHDAYPIETAR